MHATYLSIWLHSMGPWVYSSYNGMLMRELTFSIPSSVPLELKVKNYFLLNMTISSLEGKCFYLKTLLLEIGRAHV